MSDTKLAWKVVSIVLSVFVFLAFNVALLGIAVPALVSAASTFALLCGLVLGVSTLAADIGIAIIVLQKLSRKFQ